MYNWRQYGVIQLLTGQVNQGDHCHLETGLDLHVIGTAKIGNLFVLDNMAKWERTV